MKLQNLLPLLGVVGLMATSSCGYDDKKSPVKNANTAVEAAKDAVVGKTEETRAEAEAKLTDRRAEVKASIGALETKWKDETVPEFKKANQARLDSLNAAYVLANDRVEDFRKASESEWKAKRDEASKALDNAKERVASALDRQKLKEEVADKLTKIQARLDRMGPTDSDRAKLESRYQDLKNDFVRFQESTDEKWEDFKEGFSRTFKELSDTFTNLFD